MIRQTQTKEYSFSDVGLNLTPASKSLLPSALKKILSTGYNTQTVTSVAISGNVITLNYGAPHGYTKGRVLKLNTPSLNSEFVIESVESLSLTIIVDQPPSSIESSFTTHVAPLGWVLCYESANSYVQLYKLKNLDETDLYCRLTYSIANSTSFLSCIQPFFGLSADEQTGVITDTLSNGFGVGSATINTSQPSWKLAKYANSTYNSYTATQNPTLFLNTVVVGSLYHFLGMITYYADNKGFFGFVPSHCLDYEKLKYPLSFAYTPVMSSEDSGWYLADNSWNINGVKVVARPYISSGAAPTHTYPTAASSYLPATIDNFETSVAYPIEIFEATTLQFLGFIAGGMYRWSHTLSNLPASAEMPKQTSDIDFSNPLYIHSASYNGFSTGFWCVIPVEEIKIG